MENKSKFYVNVKLEVKKQDFPLVCTEMQGKFKSCIMVLGIDPYDCYVEINEDKCVKLDNHNLERELEGYKAIELLHIVEGYKECYRLIYKIIHTDQIRRIEVISFGLHDYAYSVARSRVKKS